MYQEEQCEVRKRAICKDIEKLNYNDLLNEHGEISHFAIDNLHNEERVKSYYLSGESIYRAYLESTHFNVTYIDNITAIGDDTLMRINSAKCDVEKRRLIVHAIHSIFTNLSNGLIDQNTFDLYIDALKHIEETSYILPIYLKIGIKGIEEAEYKKSNLNNAVKKFDIAEAEQLRFTPNVLRAVYDTFQTGIYIPKKEIQERLKNIYQKYQINKKVIQSTIEDYYTISESNSKDVPSFKLNSFKFDGIFLEASP